MWPNQRRTALSTARFFLHSLLTQENHGGNMSMAGMLKLETNRKELVWSLHQQDLFGPLPININLMTKS